jgi:hypothetical protein
MGKNKVVRKLRPLRGNYHRYLNKSVFMYFQKMDQPVRGHCMCKEMPVIPVNKVVDPKRIIGKNGGPRRRRGTKGC